MMKLSNVWHSRFVSLALLAAISLSCDLCAGIIYGIKDLQPLSTPVPNPADAELLQNGLTVAEAANAGTHSYAVKDAETRNGFGGVNMAATFVILQEFSDNAVTTTSDTGNSVVFTRIGVNIYQGPRLEQSDCADVLFIRTYNAEGFSNFFQCQTDKSIQALITYIITDE